jgi:hypothetical protein
MSKILSARFALYSVGLVLTASGAFGFARLSRDDAASSRSITRPSDPRQAMVAELAASRPHASLGDQAQVFDRLVGTWDCDFGFPHDDGTVTHKKGEILFGWVMDGHAIQDLWIGYPTRPGKERTIGTTIRFFDTDQKQWRIVYVGPQNNYIVTTQGGAEGDRIVLRGVDTDGMPIRWTFSEITPDSFHWQGAKSHDAGKTWKIEEDHHMTRRT